MAAPGDSKPFVILDASNLGSVIPQAPLVNHLLSSLPAISSAVRSPDGHSHPLNAAAKSSLILIPFWSTSLFFPYIGVKIAVSTAQPTTFLLIHSVTGEPLAAIDCSEFDILHLSAVSAVAANYLALPDSSVLLLVLHPAVNDNFVANVVDAHRGVRPSLTRIIVWTGDGKKSDDLVGFLRSQHPAAPDVIFEATQHLDDALAMADIVCCCRGSAIPVVMGERLKPGAHLNLLGSAIVPSWDFDDCDDEVVSRGRLFLDTEDAMNSRRLAGSIAGMLVDLAIGKNKRLNPDEITVFRSVGGNPAVEILAAQLAYKNFVEGRRYG